MNAASKTTTGISIRPTLLARLDKVARQYGVSRSRVITCILTMTLESVEDPKVGYIRASRRGFEEQLTI